jgi:hypothetical protein
MVFHREQSLLREQSWRVEKAAVALALSRCIAWTLVLVRTAVALFDTLEPFGQLGWEPCDHNDTMLSACPGDSMSRG